jgi:hypothetical protein
MKLNGFDVISRDKYTVEGEEMDFLVEDIPECDVIVTNPPFCLKFEFLEKAYASGKPFAFLLPLATLATKKGRKFFDEYGVIVGVIADRIPFIHNGEDVMVDSVAWYFGNTLENVKGLVSLLYLNVVKK